MELREIKHLKKIDYFASRITKYSKEFNVWSVNDRLWMHEKDIQNHILQPTIKHETYWAQRDCQKIIFGINTKFFQVRELLRYEKFYMENFG